MGRAWIGYDETVPVEDLFAQNRGVWKLCPRADLESHVVFAGEGKIRFVAEIHGFERFDDRRAIVGRLLDRDDTLWQRWVGRPTRGKYQNPVYYIPDD